VDLERRADHFWLITQNVDGLHRQAGSRTVIEIHGTLRQASCSGCGRTTPINRVVEFDLPECDHCHGLLRPAVVWFGEMLPPAALAAAEHAIEHCDLMLVVGTSGIVQPAASFAAWARKNGARVIEINLEETPISTVADVSLYGRSGDILPRLVAAANNGHHS
jgi:NAD-dependent deacetylase